MGRLGRPFNPSPFLSPRRRPKLTGRTLSNSSDISTSSSHQRASFDEIDVFATSAPNSPLRPNSQPDNAKTSSDLLIEKSDTPHASSQQSTLIEPIAIEIPPSKPFKPSAASPAIYTQPEPLSARGDLPGGYFSLHENTNTYTSTHHTLDTKPHLSHPKTQNSSIPSRAMHSDRNSLHTASPRALSSAATPVTSYLAPGFHDSPLPLGKYYPSNYEQHSPRLPPTSPKSMDKGKVSQEPHPSTRVPAIALSEFDSRKRLHQYQRDIVAQAALVLGSSAQGSGGVTPKGLPVREARIGFSAHKPRSPRLLPLGSPGPVTPMELESSASGYLDRGGPRSDSNRSGDPLSPAGQALASQAV